MDGGKQGGTAESFVPCSFQQRTAGDFLLREPEFKRPEDENIMQEHDETGRGGKNENQIGTDQGKGYFTDFRL